MYTTIDASIRSNRSTVVEPMLPLDSFQNDLDRMMVWAEILQICFSNGKCRSPASWGKKHKVQFFTYSLEGAEPGKPDEKYFGVLLDSRLKIERKSG